MAAEHGVDASETRELIIVGDWRTLEASSALWKRLLTACIVEVVGARSRYAFDLNLNVRVYTVQVTNTPPRAYASTNLHTGLHKFLDLRALHRPARTCEAEPVAHADVRDVTRPRDRLDLREVDQAAFVQHVVADVEVPHTAEDQSG